MGKILVVGGTGYIGRAVTEKLEALGYTVLSVGHLVLDVTKKGSISRFYSQIKDRTFDGVIYAVGNCPSGGFTKEVAIPLSEINPKVLKKDFDLHVTGLLRVIQMIKNNLSFESKILVISSGITEILNHNCPRGLYAGHYATVKAAQDQMVKWLGRDPVIREKCISIDSIKLRAVDTSFHDGAPEELKPPVLISLATAAEIITTCLIS